MMAVAGSNFWPGVCSGTPDKWDLMHSLCLCQHKCNPALSKPRATQSPGCNCLALASPTDSCQPQPLHSLTIYFHTSPKANSAAAPWPNSKCSPLVFAFRYWPFTKNTWTPARMQLNGQSWCQPSQVHLQRAMDSLELCNDREYLKELKYSVIVALL